MNYWFNEASTTTALGSNGTFTSSAQGAAPYSSLVLAAKTDQDGTLYLDFSPDGSNWDSTITYAMTAEINEVHRVTVTRPFFRTRFVNGPVAQGYFRMTMMGDNYNALTSALDSPVQQDADATVARIISDETSIASGYFTGYSITNKFGLNPDVDTGTLPEDVWEAGGVYTGWATVSEAVRVTSTSAADAAAGTGARTIRITGLDANYDVQQETVTLNGLTPVVTVATFIRVHTAAIMTAGSGGVNAGIITVGQNVTVANVFLSMSIGRNQTNTSAYTVPAGYTGYMRHLHASCGREVAVAIEGNIWTRAFGSVFRSRRPFFISNNFGLTDTIFGGLVFTEKTDIVIRITTCTTSNTPVTAGYDLILIKN